MSLVLWKQFRQKTKSNQRIRTKLRRTHALGIRMASGAADCPSGSDDGMSIQIRNLAGVPEARDPAGL